AKAVGCKPSVLLDYCAPFGLILLACVRVGCFISGCCGALTFWYHENPIVLPVQLFEAALDLALLEWCCLTEHRRFQQGAVFPTLMLGYGSYRFLLEFLRKSANSDGVFTNSHVCALACAIIGAIWLVVTLKKASAASKKTK
ncbi:MAG: prolipoprotein diacylglyceryl transferase, partial [Clostridia bacterium]|nr:prolipoprotein diacylglyceryl transferase [Clostridia bacterium]